MGIRAPRPVVVLAALALGAAACTGDTAEPGEPDDPPEVTEAPEVTGPSDGDVDWGPCPIEPPAGVDLDCGTLAVPADRDRPDGDVVRLAFGVVRAGDDAAPDPLVYLGGGPGERSLDLLSVAYDRVLAPLVDGRDLIVLDQRGTGYSEPDLTCGEFDEWAEAAFGSDEPAEQQGADAASALIECGERLAADGVDPSTVDTVTAAADLADLRLALGHDEWNLYGISYGSRLALEAMRSHPEGIRSVVLDASYPPETDLYASMPDSLARALDALDAACDADPGCADRYGDLGERFERAVDGLNDAPIETEVADPVTGRTATAPINGDTLVGIVFQAMYVTDLIPLLPEIVAAAEAGDVALVGVLTSVFAADRELASVGMQLAVQCQDEIPGTDRDELASTAARHPVLADFFDGDPRLGSGIVDVCSAWHPDDAAPRLPAEPVESDIPTLLVSGDFDPITPPSWAERAVDHLERAWHHVAPSTGHGSVAAQVCVERITQDFLGDPTTAPDVDCLDEIAPPAFTVESDVVELDAVEIAAADGSATAESVRPRAWDEVAPGVFQQSLLTELVQQFVPGITVDQLLDQLPPGDDGEPPAPVREHTGALTWEVFELADAGQRITLAVGEAPDGLHIAQLATTPDRADHLTDVVLVPVLDAYAPHEVEDGS